MKLSNLAMKNVKKSFKDYAIYFLTLTLGVCIFYVFNSIESQKVMLDISETQGQLLKSINEVIGYVSIFISLILGFLILYANSFLIKRRKKEFGVYLILGMDDKDISKILIIETIIVGSLSLFVGMVLGVLLLQGLTLVTANLLQAKTREFEFVFSLYSMVKTIIYFVATFIVVMIFNTIMIRKEKVIELLYAHRKNEKSKTRNLKLSVAIFVFSIIFIGISYKIIIENGFLNINKNLALSIILCIVGTILFFLSLSGFFLEIISKNKRIYFKGLNMFVLKQINSKVNTTYITMVMISLLMFISMFTLSMGFGISKAITKELEESTPYDATYSMGIIGEIGQNSNESIAEHGDVDIIKEFEEYGVNFNDFAKNFVEVNHYNSGIEFQLLGRVFSPDFVKVSDYNKLIKMQGEKEVVLNANEYIVNANYEKVQKAYKEYEKDNKLIIKNKEFILKDIMNKQIENDSYKNELWTIIVPDEVIDGNRVNINMVAINYLEKTYEYEDLCNEEISKEDFSSKYDFYGQFNTKISVFETANASSAMVIYIVVYIGIIFLIASLTVLAITQLSEVSDNITRYNILKKIGTEEKMINKALFSQIALYFGVPMIMASVHSFAYIYAAIITLNNELDSGINILKEIFFAGTIIIIIYLLYFIATYITSKNIISKD